MTEEPLRLAIRKTKIPGLLQIDLPVYKDERGWFKENWQREKMIHLGLPDFQPVQNNVLFNREAGITRGIHAEPWDKYVTISHGRVFSAIVDLRPGYTFGIVETFELTPERALFIPRGCGNSLQTLEANTVYSYFPNAHWDPNGKYTYVNLADDQLAIPWPIALSNATLSENDRQHPPLYQVKEALGA